MYTLMYTLALWVFRDHLVVSGLQEGSYGSLVRGRFSGTGLAIYVATGFGGIWPDTGTDGVVRVMAG